MSILPIPTSRASDYLTRQRLVQQTQSDQLELFRLQNQISTGRRIFQPSDDGRAALRSITLQRSLERSGQLQINLSSARSALTSAESSLNGVGDILNDIRAEAIGVAGTTSTDQQRLTTRTNVLTSLERLVGFANSAYQENYLFSGSASLAAPYVFNGSYVEYRGNENSQQQRVDAGVLFDTNLPGSEVFGGLSEPVRGTADLGLQLTTDTLLNDLNGGDGITAGGSIEISYVAPSTAVESEATVIDLSGARTIGDVARLIEANGPPTANLRATVTSTGLRIETDPEATTPGSIVVREVAGGRTASELSILAESPVQQIDGGELDPQIGLTTRLDDLLGTKATGRLSLAGADNDITLLGNTNGNFNDLTVVLADTAGTVGNETAVRTPGTPPVLTVSIVSGQTTAQQVVDAINAEGSFTASIDYRDATATNTAGTGVVTTVTETLVTDGATGESLDLASGLLITNGGDPFVIDTSEAETVEDLLNLLNRSETGLFAEVNATGTGIDIRTRRSGADFSIGENGGDLATQLGVRTTTAESRLEDFNRGKGVLVAPIEDNLGNLDPTSLANNRFSITVIDDGVAQTFDINLAGDAGIASDDAQTVQDVFDQIAADTGGLVSATLTDVGNGIRLSSTALADPATTAQGNVGLVGDTLTFTADTPGAASNQSFELKIVDTGGSGPLATSISGQVITVDLQGVDSTTDAIALDISTTLPGFTVASNGTAAVATTSPVVVTPADPGVAFTTAGGDDGSPEGADLIYVSGDAAQRLGFDVSRTDAIGAVDLGGDTLTFSADADGVAAGSLGNQAFTIQVTNDSPLAGVRSTTVNGNTITVELGGTTPTTDEIAADITAQLAGFTVTSNGSPPATISAPVTTPSFNTTGGFDADASSGLPGAIASSDVNTIEVDSVFNSLLRLSDALLQGEDGVPDIGRAINRLDDDLDRATAARGELGSRVQSLNSLEVRLQDEEVELRASLSEELDVDLTQAISDFTARQFALQASLQTTASLLNLSILNFI